MSEESSTPAITPKSSMDSVDEIIVFAREIGSVPSEEWEEVSRGEREAETMGGTELERELFRPLTQETQTRLTELVMASAPAENARIVPFRARRWVPWLTLIGTVAAGLALYVQQAPPSQGERDSVHTLSAQIEVSIQGGHPSDRGNEPRAARVVRRGSEPYDVQKTRHVQLEVRSSGLVLSPHRVLAVCLSDTIELKFMSILNEPGLTIMQVFPEFDSVQPCDIDLQFAMDGSLYRLDPKDTPRIRLRDSL